MGSYTQMLDYPEETDTLGYFVTALVTKNDKLRS